MRVDYCGVVLFCDSAYRALERKEQSGRVTIYYYYCNIKCSVMIVAFCSLTRLYLFSTAYLSVCLSVCLSGVLC